MKRYVFQVIIEEGSDEFWEGLEADGTTGCEDLKAEIEACFSPTGLQSAEVKLIEYTDK